MSVLDQAQNVQGVVSAARLRERWAQHMVATSDSERREQYREAIADLEARFPEIEEIPPGGAEAFARERGYGRRSRRPIHEGRRRPAASKRRESAPEGETEDDPPDFLDPDEERQERTTGRRREEPELLEDPEDEAEGDSEDMDRQQWRDRAGRARRLSGLPTAEQAWRQTGVPGAVASGTSLVMTSIGALIGLSLLYLVLTSAGSGNRALPRMLEAITGFLSRFVSTRDILPQPGDAVDWQLYRQLVEAGDTEGAGKALLPLLPELPRVRRPRHSVIPLPLPKQLGKPKSRK